MQTLGEFDAYPAKPIVFVRIALDGILECVNYDRRCPELTKHTATGFASVLTNSDVTLSVRDIFGYESVSDGRGEVWRQLTGGRLCIASFIKIDASEGL